MNEIQKDFLRLNSTEKYVATVKYLERLFDFCNNKLFNNELEKPVITVQLDSKNKTNGWFTPSKVWKWQDKVPANCADCDMDERERCENGDFSDCYKFVEREEHELNMTAQQLNRPVKAIASTMIHEMCHLYAEVNNMQDTSRSGTYHNKLFKKIAEQHGLKVECVQTSGWSHTELTPETDVLITSFVEHNPETLVYRAPVFKGQTVKTSSTRKYACPCCQQSVRATKQVNIMCLDCNQPMQEE